MKNEVLSHKLKRLRAGGAARVLDLFSGCGGLSLGMQAAGFSIRAAVEIDPEAARSHGANFHPNDQRHAKAENTTPRRECVAAELELGPVAEAVDIIVGGPPCQAFARVGRP